MFRAILIVMLFQCAVIAQSDEDTVTYSISLDDFVITAQHEPTHYKEALHQIDIIKKETIAKIGAVTLDQALILSPAIRFSIDPILGTSVKIRGMSANNVAILIDGVPVIGRNDGAIDLSQISLNNVERIEIIEGPVSNIYGSNAAGGVINIITKKSQANTWSVQQANQLESTQQRNHTANVGYQYGKINIGISARYFNYNQYPSDSLRLIDQVTLDDGSLQSNTKYPFNPKNQKSAGAYLRYNINEDQYLIAKCDYNMENVTDYGVIKRPQFNPYATDQFYTTNRKDVSLNYKGRLKNHFFVNLMASHNNYDRVRDDKRFYTETMSFDSLLQYSDSNRFEQIFSRSDFTYTGIKNWTLGTGINFSQEIGIGDRIINREAQDSLKTTFNERAIFTDLKYNGIKNVDLAIGGRWIYHNLYKNALTGSLQLKYDISDQLTLRSSYAQGYRNPSLKELYLEFIDINHHIIGNEDLQPERSQDFQTTLSYIKNDYSEYSLNAYFTSIKDRITLLSFETLKFQYNNLDSYRVFGVQPSFKIQIKGIHLSSNFAIGFWSTDEDHENVPNYKRIIDINNTIDYKWHYTGISLLLNHRYTGAEPNYTIINEEIEIGRIEGYHLLDFSLSKSVWHKHLKFIIGCKNITNTTTINSLNSTGGTHSSGNQRSINIGRRWFLTSSVQF